jgi:hypothetical protein
MLLLASVALVRPAEIWVPGRGQDGLDTGPVRLLYMSRGQRNREIPEKRRIRHGEEN